MLQDRLTYGQVYGISPERKGAGSCLPPRAFPATLGGAARRRRGRISAAELAERNGEEPEEPYAGSRCPKASSTHTPLPPYLAQSRM